MTNNLPLKRAISTEKIYAGSIDDKMNNQEKRYEYYAEIPFANARFAKIAQRALQVDPELRPDIVERKLRPSGDCLIIEMKAQDPKSLRVAVSSLYDFLQVCVRTINTFGTDDCSGVVETNNFNEGRTQPNIE